MNAQKTLLSACCTFLKRIHEHLRLFADIFDNEPEMTMQSALATISKLRFVI